MIRRFLDFLFRRHRRKRYEGYRPDYCEGEEPVYRRAREME